MSGKVRISTLRNENETFSQLNSITYIGVFLRLVTYSHLPQHNDTCGDKMPEHSMVQFHDKWHSFG